MPQSKNLNSFGSLATLQIKGKEYQFYSLKALSNHKVGHPDRLPFSLKILLENLLRHEDGVAVKKREIEALLQWNPKAEPRDEIQFMPARVLLQDFTGVPAVADLAAMRGAISRLGGDPKAINPLQPADLVIDHSVQVDVFGTKDAYIQNAEIEFQRNSERYQFLKWGQQAFKNFRVVPPDTGIVHQVNLEYLSHVTMTAGSLIYPDTVVGTDSHTTMINGLGVLGWGVGGIEAEAAMLGQPCTMLIPHVVGFRLIGRLPVGANATDLVLTITEILRKKGVVGKFVEFFGPGLAHISLSDRATIGNMAPEYGATAGLFPVDQVTIDYLKLTGRSERAELVEAYFKEQGLWYTSDSPEAEFSNLIELDLSSIEPSLAGPSRPQDRVSLEKSKESFHKFLIPWCEVQKIPLDRSATVQDPRGNYDLKHGSVVIAAITSCTNTSNPGVLIAAGLLAKKAVEKGLKVKPWVKTSLAPGSTVVTNYLGEAGLMKPLEELNFHLVGYGCTTCIGNSGPLPHSVSKAITEQNLAVVSVLSGNRNFEGRINTQVRGNYLASPPLVVAFAIAGTIQIDLNSEPVGMGSDGKPVFLKDIWPSMDEIREVVQKHVTPEQFKKSYSEVFLGEKKWRDFKVAGGEIYEWQPDSEYIKEPPFFDHVEETPSPVSEITQARVLVMLGDSITTDHISPAGSFGKSSSAGQYLLSKGVSVQDFNSYGARRGNHEVMVRGTFANVRLKNFLVPGVEGAMTQHFPDGKQMSIFDASVQYKKDQVPLIVIAGKEYGTGSSRDWAAKGPLLLGIKAVIAEGFERIHRSNLIGMGILPLQFLPGESAKSHGLTGSETFDILGLTTLTPAQRLEVRCQSSDQTVKTITTLVRIDTPNELEYFRHGGILPYVLRQILKAPQKN